MTFREEKFEENSGDWETKYARKLLGLIHQIWPELDASLKREGQTAEHIAACGEADGKQS